MLWQYKQSIRWCYENKCLFPALLAAAAHSTPTPPNFSDTYTVKGTLYIPYAEIREPFYAWYDLKLGSSRIDYYGGKLN